MSSSSSSSNPGVQFQVEKIEIYDPDPGKGWGSDAKLAWDDIIFRGESLRFKITLDQPIADPNDYDHKVEFKEHGSDTDYIELPLDNATTEGNELRVTITFQQLVDLGILPTTPWDDSVLELCSADSSARERQRSNRKDSDAFDEEGKKYFSRSRQRGKARGAGDLDRYESKANTKFLKAAGILWFKLRSDGVYSQQRQMHNQADYFYVSGHGDHNKAIIKTGKYGQIKPDDVNYGSYWKMDLDAVFIAGCAILDIKDYNKNYKGDKHNDSPGEKWITTGPKKFFGYCWIAPQDEQLGDYKYTAGVIKDYFKYKKEKKSDSDAWGQANIDLVNRAPEEYRRHDHRLGRGYNCCMIDLTKTPNEYWCFIGSKKKGYTWTPIRRNRDGTWPPVPPKPK